MMSRIVSYMWYLQLKPMAQSSWAYNHQSEFKHSFSNIKRKETSQRRRIFWERQKLNWNDCMGRSIQPRWDRAISTNTLWPSWLWNVKICRHYNPMNKIWIHSLSSRNSLGRKDLNMIGRFSPSSNGGERWWDMVTWNAPQQPCMWHKQRDLSMTHR